MNYPETKIMQAFQLYTRLARDGVIDIDAVQHFRGDEEIRGLLEAFGREVDCVLVTTSEQMFLIPKTRLSPFHVSNDWIKRNYLRGGSTNGDIYLLYFASIILFGSFYDSYHSQSPTRQFLRLDEWVVSIQDRIEQLKSHDVEELKELEKEFSYNWGLIIEKWDDMDDVKETAKKQSGNTISRLSFIDTVKRFLVDQELIKEIGNDEITITEKAKTIVQRFFMEIEYNKGVLEFIYGFERGKEHAID